MNRTSRRNGEMMIAKAKLFFLLERNFSRQGVLFPQPVPVSP
jgi:hypothetical protein